MTTTTPVAINQEAQEALDEIVRRIVRIAQPEKIILFGSFARGDAGPHSDFDLLVIKSGDIHHRDLAGRIYMGLIGVGHPVDIVVATPEEVERYRNVHALVIAPAMREGQEIYAA